MPSLPFCSVGKKRITLIVCLFYRTIRPLLLFIQRSLMGDQVHWWSSHLWWMCLMEIPRMKHVTLLRPWSSATWSHWLMCQSVWRCKTGQNPLTECKYVGLIPGVEKCRWKCKVFIVKERRVWHPRGEVTFLFLTLLFNLIALFGYLLSIVAGKLIYCLYSI